MTGLPRKKLHFILHYVIPTGWYLTRNGTLCQGRLLGGATGRFWPWAPRRYPGPQPPPNRPKSLTLGLEGLARSLGDDSVATVCLSSPNSTAISFADRPYRPTYLRVTHLPVRSLSTKRTEEHFRVLTSPAEGLGIQASETDLKQSTHGTAMCESATQGTTTMIGALLMLASLRPSEPAR